MAHVAELAGISRQALYLHFADRNALAIAIAGFADQRYGLATAVQPMLRAHNPDTLLKETAHFAARYNPRIYPVARMMRALARADEAMAAALADRQDNRRQGFRNVATHLETWGALSSEWTVRSATDWATSVLSPWVYEEQVLEMGVSLKRYRDTTELMLKRTLLKR